MTINEFVNNSPFKIPDHIIVYGITENHIAREVHLVYDSYHWKCSQGMSDLVKNATLDSVGASSHLYPDALVLTFVTDKFLYEYL